MSELKIDNKHLASLADVTKKFIDVLEQDNKAMLDEKEDLFKRYMAYIRLSSLNKMLVPTIQMTRNLLVLGHSLSNEKFHTAAAIEAEWDKVHLEKNPFFVQSEEENDDQGIPDEFKKLIIKALKLAMAENLHEC